MRTSIATGILRTHGVVGQAAERGSHRGGQDYGDRAVLDRRLHAGDVLGRCPRPVPSRPLAVRHRAARRGARPAVRRRPPLALAVDADPHAGRRRSGARVRSRSISSRCGRPKRSRSTRSCPVTATWCVTTGATIAARFERYARITEQTLGAVTAEPRTAAEIAARAQRRLAGSDRVLRAVRGARPSRPADRRGRDRRVTGRPRRPLGSRGHDVGRRHRRLARARAGDRGRLRARRRAGGARGSATIGPAGWPRDVGDPDAMLAVAERFGAPDVLVCCRRHPGPDGEAVGDRAGGLGGDVAREPDGRLRHVPGVPAGDGRARVRERRRASAR